MQTGALCEVGRNRASSIAKLTVFSLLALAALLMGSEMPPLYLAGLGFFVCSVALAFQAASSNLVLTATPESLTVFKPLGSGFVLNWAWIKDVSWQTGWLKPEPEPELRIEVERSHGDRSASKLFRVPGRSLKGNGKVIAEKLRELQERYS